MNLIKENWISTDYNEFINYLYKLKDEKYKEFNQSLGINNELIGIRTPELKRISKEISKGNYQQFLSLCQDNYYEEITIYGLIVANIKDLEESIKYLNIYKTKINNWASCDLFCSSYKIIKKNKELFYKYILENIISSNPWIRRLCFVLLLDYYIEENYLNNIFKLCNKYNTEDYYVEMSVAWLISICYIKYPNQTIKYIKNNKLNNFTHNKAIQKIRESLRVSKEEKDNLNKLKR